MIRKIRHAAIQEPITRIIGDYLVSTHDTEILGYGTFEIAAERVADVLRGTQFFVVG